MGCRSDLGEMRRLLVAETEKMILGQESNLCQMRVGISAGKIEGIKLVRLVAPHHCHSGLMVKLMLPDMGLVTNIVTEVYVTKDLHSRSSSL